MKASLPEIFQSMVVEMRLAAEVTGSTLEVFDSLERVEKSSLGVYVERNSRGFHLTVWVSGEAQASTIDYLRDASPSEEYFPEVNADWLGSKFRNLLEWLQSDDGMKGVN